MRSGYRMPAPDGMPANVAEVMTKHCWNTAPADRYSMMQVSVL